ncbi:MAG TPA: FAD-dependent monooxygenase [Streptosporangiaceae bacterium]|nr:FAD-dependent monooxygenase [Streptosporangiaceae bacterium]
MKAQEAVVVGAGIGGLGTAIGLTRAGWHVTVLERARELRPVGGGLGLTPNGVHALKALGAGDRVRAAATEQSHGGIRTPSGDWISRTDLSFIHARYGEPVMAIHRARLIDILRELLPSGALVTGTPVSFVDPGGPQGRAHVHTKDGVHAADLVVAADGIRSAIRAELFPAHPGLTYAGYTSWRVVLNAPEVTIAGETWGRGKRFSILPLPDGLVHCSALAVAPPGCRSDSLSELAGRFGTWHSPIPELIEASGASEVVHRDIEELAVRLPRFHAGRVALVGDAAHAMTPNLGSACLALEDAVTLSHLVTAAPDDGITDALARYSRWRGPRSAALARMSRRIGEAGKLSFAPAVTVRNAGFRIAGLMPSLTVRALDQMMDWRPPTVVSGQPAASAR